MSELRTRLNGLYFGTTSEALRFQSWMLLFDLGLRAFAFGNLRKWLRRPVVWADFAVLASLIAPVFAANLGFLRIMRVYSLVQGEMLWRVTGNGRWADTNVQDATRAAANLGIFVFVATSIVHVSFAGRTTHINSYLDSLYFTVTTLSTTGYGDIVLPGQWGKVLSIIIMIGGVSLFIRLVQVTMRGAKVRHACPKCGLLRHDPDAIHCKACGAWVNILHDND